MSTYLTAEIRYEDGFARISLSGELDMDSAGRFAPELSFHQSTSQGVVFDLTRLQLIDSCGIEMLCVSVERARELGTKVYLDGCSDDVFRILELTGTDRWIDRYPAARPRLVRSN